MSRSNADGGRRTEPVPQQGEPRPPSLRVVRLVPDRWRLLRPEHLSAMLLVVVLTACSSRGSSVTPTSSPSASPRPLVVTGEARLVESSLEVSGVVRTFEGQLADGVEVTVSPLFRGTALDAIAAVAPGGSCLLVDCSHRNEGRTRSGRFALGYLNPRSHDVHITAVAPDGSRVELESPTLGGLPDLRLWDPPITGSFDGPMLAVQGFTPPATEGQLTKRGVVMRNATGIPVLRTSEGSVDGFPADARLARPGAVTWAPFVELTARTAEGHDLTLTFEGRPHPLPASARPSPLKPRTCVVTGGEKPQPCNYAGTRPPSGTAAVIDLGHQQHVSLVVAADCLGGCLLDFSEDGVTWQEGNSLMRGHLNDCRCIVTTAGIGVDRKVRWLRVRQDSLSSSPSRGDWYDVRVYGGVTPQGVLAPR